MTPHVSVILPFCNQASDVREIVTGHVASMMQAGILHELILVPNGSADDTNTVCRALAAEYPTVRSIEIDKRDWGAAVRAGISAAAGSLICYTNSARTQSEDLERILAHALHHDGAVVKAVRVNRHGLFRRLGSRSYNTLCAALLDLRTGDVNGTPKVFPRTASTLCSLAREDDLIDLEFMWRCAVAGLPVSEIPIYRHERRGGHSTTGWRTALRLYAGAIAFWWRVRIGGRHP